MTLYEFKIIDDGGYVQDPWQDAPIAVRFMPRPFVGQVMKLNNRQLVVTGVDTEIPALLVLDKIKYEQRMAEPPSWNRLSRTVPYSNLVY